MANAARGGGLESGEFYHNMKITFLNIENIHAMRHSLFKVYFLIRYEKYMSTSA